jgi:hypothetical protein
MALPSVRRGLTMMGGGGTKAVLQIPQLVSRRLPESG